jgi:hypothetical protein
LKIAIPNFLTEENMNMNVNRSQPTTSLPSNVSVEIKKNGDIKITMSEGDIGDSDSGCKPGKSHGSDSSLGKSGTANTDSSSFKQKLEGLLEKILAKLGASSGVDGAEETDESGGADESGDTSQTPKGTSGTSGSKPAMTDAQAGAALFKDKSAQNKDGTIDEAKLQELASGTTKDGHAVDPKTQEAAQHFLGADGKANAAFSELESAANGKKDGKAALGDVGKNMEHKSAQAADAMDKAGLFKDGKDYNQADIDKMAQTGKSPDGKDLSDDAKAAVKFFSENPNAFKAAGKVAADDDDGKMGGADAKSLVNGDKGESKDIFSQVGKFITGAITGVHSDADKADKQFKDLPLT